MFDVMRKLRPRENNVVDIVLCKKVGDIVNIVLGHRSLLILDKANSSVQSMRYIERLVTLFVLCGELRIIHINSY